MNSTSKTSEVKAHSTDVVRRVPEGMRASDESEVTAKTKTTAALYNEVEGQCPVCKRQMSVSTSNGIGIYVCMNHRVAMPLPNTSTL